MTGKALRMAIFLFTRRIADPHLQAVLSRLEETVVYDREDRRRPGPGDLIILDLATEGSEWEEGLFRCRREHPEAALLAILQERQLERMKQDLPMDDFLVEGCGEKEVEARVGRLLKSTRRSECSKGLVIDVERYEVRLDGEPVELTYKEFELLRYLSSNPGKVFTRQALLKQVWGYDYFGGSRTVDVHIRRIRSKIEKEGRTFIRTIRGVGYMFEPEGFSPDVT